MVLRSDPEAIAAYRVILAHEEFTPQTHEDVTAMSDADVWAAVSNALTNAVRLGPGFEPARSTRERLADWLEG